MFYCMKLFAQKLGQMVQRLTSQLDTLTMEFDMNMFQSGCFKSN